MGSDARGCRAMTFSELSSSQVAGRVFGCSFDDIVGVDLRHAVRVHTEHDHNETQPTRISRLTIFPIVLRGRASTTFRRSGHL